VYFIKYYGTQLVHNVCIWLANKNIKKYRPNECISEPMMAFKVDGRGCLSKHQPTTPGNYWHFDWSVECIGLLWSASTLQKLQQVARVCGVSKFQQQQSEDLLHELHWLPVRKQIHYKIATRHCIYTVSQKKNVPPLNCL